MIKFLNTLFDGEFRVLDVKFQNKELLPPDPDGKRILYDVYCINKHGNKEHFIIEMQNNYEPFWESRALFYTATAITSQGRRGIEYELEPVFSIFIMDFNLESMSKVLKHDIRFMDISTHERYSDDVRMIFLSLKMVKTTWEECTNELERMLFLIKNMHRMDKKSKPYDNPEYRELFDAAEISSLAAEDAVTYNQSVLGLASQRRAIEYASKKAEGEGLKKGKIEGREEGRMEGREKAMTEMVMKLYNAGMTPEFIQNITGFGLDEISKIIIEQA